MNMWIIQSSGIRISGVQGNITIFVGNILETWPQYRDEDGRSEEMAPSYGQPDPIELRQEEEEEVYVEEEE